MLPTPVQPVLAERPRSGLVAWALTPDQEDARWVDGMAWRPERCMSALSYDACATGPGIFGTEHGPGQSGTVYYRPLVARVEDQCYARGSNPDEDLARVRRQLEGATSWLVARELWTGEASDANAYSVPGEAGTFTNARLAGGTAVRELTGTHEPLHALGALEQAARGALGSLGMEVWLHMPITLLPYVDGGIVREGSGLFTKAGSRVIADAGYTGSDPNNAMQAGALWMYATGPVQVRLTAVQALQDVEQRTNLVTSRAERVYAATFDPCNLHGVAVAVPATT